MITNIYMLVYSFVALVICLIKAYETSEDFKDWLKDKEEIYELEKEGVIGQPFILWLVAFSIVLFVFCVYLDNVLGL